MDVRPQSVAGNPVFSRARARWRCSVWWAISWCLAALHATAHSQPFIRDIKHARTSCAGGVVGCNLAVFGVFGAGLFEALRVTDFWVTSGVCVCLWQRMWQRMWYD